MNASLNKNASLLALFIFFFFLFSYYEISLGGDLIYVGEDSKGNLYLSDKPLRNPEIIKFEERRFLHPSVGSKPVERGKEALEEPAMGVSESSRTDDFEKPTSTIKNLQEAAPSKTSNISIPTEKIDMERDPKFQVPSKTREVPPESVKNEAQKVIDRIQNATDFTASGHLLSFCKSNPDYGYLVFSEFMRVVRKARIAAITESGMPGGNLNWVVFSMPCERLAEAMNSSEFDLEQKKEFVNFVLDCHFDYSFKLERKDIELFLENNSAIAKAYLERLSSLEFDQRTVLPTNERKKLIKMKDKAISLERKLGLAN